MDRECPSCGKTFNPREVCSRCASLYSSSICLACCIDRGVCSARSTGLSGDEAKLLELLEKQYNEKMFEMTKCCELVPRVRNLLGKLYFEKIAFDASRHASVLRTLISLVKEKEDIELSNIGLSLEEIDRLRERGRESMQTYLAAMNLASSDEVRLLIKDLLLDEDHHFKIVSEIWLLLFDGATRRRIGRRA